MKHGQRLNLVAIAIALPLVAVLCALVPAFFLLGISLFFLGFVGEVLGVALAVRFALGKAWRPRRRFPSATV